MVKPQPAVYKRLHQPLHPGWVVYNRLLSDVYLAGLHLDSYPWTLNITLTILELYPVKTLPNIQSHPPLLPHLYLLKSL